MLREKSRTTPRSSLLFGCLIVAACGGSSGPSTNTDGNTAPNAGNTAPVAPGAAGSTAPRAGTSAAAGNSATPATGTAGTTQPPTAAAGTGAAGSGPAAPTAGAAAAAGGAAPPTTTPGAGGGSVLEFHANAKRDGHYVAPALTRAAAAGLKRDMAFSATMSGPTYAQPLYFEGGPEGKDIVITATETNEVSAFDATTGAMVWRTMVAPAGPQGGGPGGCALANIRPTLGVTGTPVIDAASRTLFVAAMTTGGKHNIFALSLDDGKVKPGWPVDVSTVQAGGKSFNSPAQHQRGALAIVNGVVYVPYGGHYGDCGDYRGWVVGVPVNDPKAPLAWVTRGSAGGVWAPSGVASDGKSVFIATGNTMAAPSGAFPMFSSPSMWSDGEAIIRLPPDLNFDSANTKDFFTPQNWAALDQTDADVGGSGVILFDAPGSMPSALAIALGKDGSAFLASQENLGGMGGQVGMPVRVAGGAIMQSAAAYTAPSGTFVAMRARGTGCSTPGNITGLKVAGSPPTVSVGWCGGSASSTGSPIVTTTDGTADSIVWYVGGGSLIGLDGESGTQVVSVSGVGSADIWQTPIVAKGRIYFAASNQVYAFSL